MSETLAVIMHNKTSERVLKIERERDCERGGADGEARGGRIFPKNL